MKTLESNRSVIVESVGGERRHFGVSRDDEAHVLMMLRDALYSDRIMAVLREYSSNAWDAHREAGKSDLPIEVTLPTLADPTLVVKDYGSGISHEDMMGRFLMAGSSTKRGSDETVGTFGIGRLSGFAYGDSFVVESRHGARRTYVAALDKSERGEIRMIDDQLCAFADTGLTVRIACRGADCATFADRALALFPYFEPRPKINLALPPLPDRVGRGFLQDSATGWHAVMGCVRYRIDLAQIAPNDFVGKLGGVLYFDVGDLRVAASREALKYDDGTKALVSARIREFVDDYVRHRLEAMERADISPWQRRLEAQALRVFDLQWLKDHCGDLLESRVVVEDKAFALSFACKARKRENRGKFPGIDVDSRSRLIIRDDKRALVGFDFKWRDCVVKSTVGEDAAKLEYRIHKVLATRRCDGMEIIKTSALPWTRPHRENRSNGGAKSPKYSAKMFAYKGNGRSGSDAWDIIDREPKKSDIYVVLDKFARVNSTRTRRTTSPCCERSASSRPLSTATSSRSPARRGASCTTTGATACQRWR